MPLNLTKPDEGDVGWADEVNQNFTDIETSVNGLGTMADQDATSVVITGGSVTGIGDLAVLDGGTGASDAAGAQANLQVPPRTRTINTASPLTGGGDLTADRTIGLGTVAEANGGTNQTSYAAGDIVYASAPNTLSKLAKGTDGQVLTLASGLPSWATPSGTSGDVLSTQHQASGTSLSYTIPGGTLTSDGQAIEIYITGRTGSDSNDDPTLTVGGTTIDISGTSISSNVRYEIVIYIVRYGSSSQLVSASLNRDGAKGSPAVVTTAHAWASDITVTTSFDTTLGTPAVHSMIVKRVTT